MAEHHELREGLRRTAAAVLSASAARADERVAVLADDGTSGRILSAIVAALRELGADAAVLTIPRRVPAFADIPEPALEALLAADFAIDLTSVPWLYSDSWTRYCERCCAAGSRMALVWGDPGSERTVAACPPSATLAEHARRGQRRLERARELHVRSPHGTDLTVDLGDPAEHRRGFIGEPPVAPGQIGALLCASVTTPFVPGSAHGTIAFVGAGRFQGPVNRPVRADEPVRFRVERGRIVALEGSGRAWAEIADWWAAAPTPDVSRVMDCNIGFDPRADLAWGDNTVVHSRAGGLMVGIADPYRHDPAGSHRPGWHLDLMLPDADVELDGQPYIRAGRFVEDAGAVS